MFGYQTFGEAPFGFSFFASIPDVIEPVDPPLPPGEPIIGVPIPPVWTLNLAWLIAEIEDWLHRKNLTAKIPTFIMLAEAEINRKLGIAPKEVEIPLVMTPGSRFVYKPLDMGQPIALWSEFNQPRERLTATMAESLNVDAGNSGSPTYWAIDGAFIALDKAADQAYPLTFRYVRDTALTVANPGNELLNRNPDLYLYGALSQAAPYMRDDARVAMWKSEFARLLRDVHAEYNRSKSVATLRTEVPTSFLSR